MAVKHQVLNWICTKVLFPLVEFVCVCVCVGVSVCVAFKSMFEDYVANSPIWVDSSIFTCVYRLRFLVLIAVIIYFPLRHGGVAISPGGGGAAADAASPRSNDFQFRRGLTQSILPGEWSDKGPTAAIKAPGRVSEC